VAEQAPGFREAILIENDMRNSERSGVVIPIVAENFPPFRFESNPHARCSAEKIDDTIAIRNG
jgi:hypothetical protein